MKVPKFECFFLNFHEKSVKNLSHDKAEHLIFILQICPKAVTLDAKNPARDFHPILQLCGVFLHNSFVYTI